jgi:hypothetical protein
MSEVLNGDSLTIAEAAKLIPAHRGSGGKSHRSRIWRWIKNGYRRPGGALVHLEHVQIGAQLVTSRAALQRFVAAISGQGAADAPEEQPERTPSEKRKAGEAAARRLAAAGA